MAEPGADCARRIPAPYIPSTVTLLASEEREYIQAVFYRSGDPYFARLPVDYFAVGNFAEQSYRWSSCRGPGSWSEITRGLESCFATDSTLAGYISYEAGYGYERVWHNLRRPLSGYAWRFLQVPCWYEADHQCQTGSFHILEQCSAADLECLQRAVDWAADGANPITEPALMTGQSNLLGELGELSCSAYSATIDQILADISAGRYYELNFTQRFTFTSPADPTAAFIRLFKKYTPRRAFYCRFPDEVIGSCSPELFLKKTGNQLHTRPIKGSLKAGSSSPALLEKLKAEHTMVVDLARNDIGRVSDQEWVHVPEFGVTSSFGGLNHIESLISGSTSMTISDILSRTYPAASITGAPKVEVVKAIGEYEVSRRGVYTGACGWISPVGDFDLNVAIRTFTASPLEAQWSYTLGSGGAIVADSNPVDEYEECLRKIRPIASELLEL